jgi:hypothetical protein
MADTLDVAGLVKKNALRPAGTTINTEYYALGDDILVAGAGAALLSSSTG